MDDENLKLDLTGVFAYTDVSYARERELWRGFLSYVLPIIIHANSEKIDQEISLAVVSSTEELTFNFKNIKDKSDSLAIRCISTQLAKEIGVSPEFALASFYEGSLPTKLFPLKIKTLKNKRKNVINEDKIISTWLSSFSKLQNDKKFMHKAEKWTSWIK